MRNSERGLIVLNLFRLVVLFACTICATAAFAQVSPTALNVIVCGPLGTTGETYASAAGRAVDCGTDANGNQLVLQVDQLVAVNPATPDPEAFDYTQAAGFWFSAFSSVFLLYFASKGIGAVVEFVRRL